MSDPTRLTEAGGDALALERDLLSAGRAARLPARARDDIWSGLAIQLAVPGAPGHAGPGAGAAAAKALPVAKALSVATVVKGTILAVALGGGSFTAYRALTPVAARPSSRVAAPAPAVAPPALAPLPPALAPPAPEPEAPPAPSRSTHRPPTSRLAAESRVVLEARRDLREGRYDEALRRLEAARAELGDGALAQEREALSIEALARAGHRDLASARAASFLRAYPGSPHAARVRTFAAP